MLLVLGFLLGGLVATGYLRLEASMREDNRVDRHLKHTLLLILTLLRQMLKELKELNGPRRRRVKLSGIHLTKETRPMAIPVILNSEEKLLLSFSPVKPDGSPDPDVDIAFSSSDASVGIEEQGDGRSAFILTPGESGSAVITASAPGYEKEEFEVSYAPPVRGRLNPSVGVPQSDL